MNANPQESRGNRGIPINPKPVQASAGVAVSISMVAYSGRGGVTGASVTV